MLIFVESQPITFYLHICVSLTRSLLLSYQNDRWCTCHVIKCQSIVITVKAYPPKPKNAIVAKVTNVDKRKVRTED